ncbi:Uncharacterised protein [uncultured archaeon]|nr:Uncharacterised protein [uncultured archaeon]
MADEKTPFTGAHYGMLLDTVTSAMCTDSLEPLEDFNKYVGVPAKLYEHALKAQAHIMKIKGWGEDKAVLISSDGKKEGMVPSTAVAQKEKGETPHSIPERIIFKR